MLRLFSTIRSIEGDVATVVLYLAFLAILLSQLIVDGSDINALVLYLFIQAVFSFIVYIAWVRHTDSFRDEDATGMHVFSVFVFLGTETSFLIGAGVLTSSNLAVGIAVSVLKGLQVVGESMYAWNSLKAGNTGASYLPLYQDTFASGF